MKNFKYIVFALIIGLIFIPNVFAKGDVEIKSIDLVSKSDNTTIKADPTFSGLEMNFDLAFKTKNDNAKYKVVIKNDTNTDYQISEDTSFNTSEYISYSYKADSVLKAKGETTVYVTITYSKEVDSSLLVDGKYSETNKAIVQLMNEDGTIVNPKTSTANVIILIALLIGTIIIVSLLKKNHKLKYSTMILIIGIVSIPTVVFAIETIKLTMNVKVSIEKGYEVGYLINNYPVIVKDSELSSYNMVDSECLTLYVGTVSDDNKYNYCHGDIIKKDGRLYSAGETVQLKTIKLRYIDLLSEPIQQSPGVFLSTDGVVYEDGFDIRGWEYNTNVSNAFGYLYSNNDKSLMNFRYYDFDSWDDHGYFVVSSPQSFTMPAHNVLFKNYVEQLQDPNPDNP